MQQLSYFLKHPLLKIFVSPFAYVLFGIIAGIANGSLHLVSIALLYAITISTHMIDHYFFVKHQLNRPHEAPEFILYASEIVLLMSTLIFLMVHHWALSMILFMYVIFVHIQYFPYDLTQTPYSALLSIFFQAIVLNSLAFFTQAKSIQTTFMIALVPLVVMQVFIQNESRLLKEALLATPPVKWLVRVPLLSLIVAAGAIISGVATSLPSRSFGLMQAVFLGVCGFLLLPLLVTTTQEKHIQNKQNYLSAIYLVFAFMYGLSYIF
ncbi:MAG: hypothetical protein Q4B80_03770 [Aerococcaceae bacterium]|nr:hypothetical protein [Aerococcaceae bacterium]